MKTHLLILSLILIGSIGLAQNFKAPKTDLTINLNDTSYFRVFNGTIIKNNYMIKDLGAVQYIFDKQKITELGIKTTLPLMLVNIKSFKIEYKIDSILYSRPNFISSFKFSSTIQLPISINGKLLTYEDRQNILSKLELSKIKEINYISSSVAMKIYGVTPFGIIDLFLK